MDRQEHSTSDEQRAILRLRAQRLARKKPADDRRERIEVVEFRMADEYYAVESLYVREVYPLRHLTPLPGTPDFIAGIISVRGEILSVVDLKKFFDMPQKGLTDLTRVIILNHPAAAIDMEFGILAEEVLGARSLCVDDIQPSLPALTGILSDYLKGVAKDRLTVLDAAALLSDRKMTVHQEVDNI
jgi:purine-binding chemotaxis protein CheW